MNEEHRTEKMKIITRTGLANKNIIGSFLPLGEKRKGPGLSYIPKEIAFAGRR